MREYEWSVMCGKEWKSPQNEDAKGAPTLYLARATCGEMSAKQQTKGCCGLVLCSSSPSFVGLEEIVRIRDAKGCYFDRAAHRKEKEMKRWLQVHNEEDYPLGLLKAVRVGIGEILKKDKMWDEIRAATAQLVADLPSSFCDEVRKDAESIAAMYINLNTGAQWLTFRLEIVQHNPCLKWHQDYCISRAIIPLVGTGTCTAEDKAVNWEEFYDVMQNTSNDSCVRHEDIKQMKVNSVLLMKGGLWPGICGRGLTHKAPVTSGEKRLLLKVDLDNDCPPLDFKDFSSSSEGEDEDSDDNSWISDIEVGDSGELKRLTTSEGFQQSKKWKYRRT